MNEKLIESGKKWLPLAALLLFIVLGVWVRVQPYNLKATDQFAENFVYGELSKQIRTELRREFPNLPAANLEREVSKQLTELIAKEELNSPEETVHVDPNSIKGQVGQVSEFYKAQFRDRNGDMFLMGIDPYKWLRQTQNIIKHGYEGDYYNEKGEMVDSLMRGRHGYITKFNIHSRFAALTSKITGFSAMKSLSLTPMIIGVLSLIPAFFIGKKVAGLLGGTFAAMILTFHPVILQRTVVGFADTDCWHLLLPLSAICLFLYGRELVKWWHGGLILASGLLVGLHGTFWSGYWYILDLILGVIILSSVLHRDWVGLLTKVSLFLTGTVAFLGTRVLDGLLRPLWFIQFKNVKSDLWPNVLTTVAELNKSSLNGVMVSVGMGIFVFAIVGIIFSYVKLRKDKDLDWAIPILLTGWFFATLYASVTSLRFSFLFIPAMSVCFGFFVYYLSDSCVSYFKNHLHLDGRLAPLIILSIILVLISPIAFQGLNQAEKMVPSFDSNFADIMGFVTDNSEEAIITSWWDFGHFFKTMSGRSVTFDGGDQGRRIYWVGKLLASNDSEESRGILRMLNCNQTRGYDVMYNVTLDTPHAIDNTLELVKMSRVEAEQFYTEDVLKHTHCEDTWKQYLILSADMVGKATVWGHFGNWDFVRAEELNDTFGRVEESQVVGWPRLGHDGSCDPLLCDSVFKRLFIDDEQIPGFRKVAQANSFTVGTVKLYEVDLN